MGKVLLIGEERICQQIAYVMDYADYHILPTLTDDVVVGNDVEIIVGEFRRKAKKLLKIKNTKSLKIKYLENLCAQIDAEVAAFNRPVSKVINTKHHQTTQSSAIVATQPIVKTETKPSFMHKVFCKLRKIYRVLKRIPRGLVKRTKKLFRKKSLKDLRPSELFLKVLYAPPINIQCDRLEQQLNVNSSGKLRCCCDILLPVGNLLTNHSLDEIYYSLYARIIKLSSINRSYCFCNLPRANFCQRTTKVNHKLKIPKRTNPQQFSVSIDRSCNLCCPSCRQHLFIPDENYKQRMAVLADKIRSSSIFAQAETIALAGHGEVFYSKYYRDILFNGNNHKNVHIMSNGILFNKDNWQLIKDKYERIQVSISIDAATKATYAKLRRGGDFDVLMKNMKMLGELRRNNEIESLVINFVVQIDNYREMIDFVKLGKSINADRIHFSNLHLWHYSDFSPAEYITKSLVIKNKYLDYELYKILQDPIFQDPAVDLRGFYLLLKNSDRLYQQRYRQEQKQQGTVI